MLVYYGLSHFLVKYLYSHCNNFSNLDLVNIMGYDMQQLDKTSVHAPLKRENNDPSKKETLVDLLLLLSLMMMEIFCAFVSGNYCSTSPQKRMS